MTVDSVALEPLPRGRRGGGLFLGLSTELRKETMEWVRGRRALVVGLISLAAAAFSTVISFIAGEAPPGAPPLSMDPTTNVLLGWGSLSFELVVLLATIGLLSAERDRGTLAWSLSHPVSRTSVLAAKWGAGLLVYGVVGIFIPLAVSSAVATVVYGSVPNLGAVGLFAGLYLMVPAFYIGLTVALGTFVRSTPAIAAIGLAVMFLPSVFGGLLPIVREASPTSIGGWALATAVGQSAPMLPLVGWLAAMAVLGIGAKIVFDRQEF
jgi:ABC-type transport system involved in multi-copper enzyme maturation permease subunit